MKYNYTFHPFNATKYIEKSNTNFGHNANPYLRTVKYKTIQLEFLKLEGKHYTCTLQEANVLFILTVTKQNI